MPFSKGHEMTAANIAPPAASEYAEYYQQYLGKVPEGDFLAAFDAQPGMLRTLVGNLPNGEDNKLHEPYTWTLKQVVGHLIDVERIFSTRMLRIGVGDETPLPGFEQNAYVAALDYETVSMDALLDEFEALRRANAILARRMGPEALARVGTASDDLVSARANLYILCGHVEYHAEIMRTRLA